MKIGLISAVIPLVLVYAGSVAAQERLVRFEGGIGVIPFASVNTNVTPNVPALNVVRGKQPGGQPWIISRLSADIRVDGRISVDGRGLLLAGGNNIGTNGNQSVHAVLFCGPATNFTEHSSGVFVPLEPDGDFRIEAFLNPMPPEPCTTPVLLIIANVMGTDRWFAAGIPRQ